MAVLEIIDAGDRAGTDTAYWRIVDELTRRGLLAGAAGVGVLGGAGCGVTAEQPRPTGGERTVDTALGKKQLPRTVRRAISLDYFPALTMLDLGITPVGVIDYSATGDLPDRYAALKGTRVKVIGQNGQPDLEAVKSLSPDLIVSQNYRTSIPKQRDLYRQLEGSATTAVFAMDHQSDWTGCAGSVATALGRADRMRTVKRRVDARAAQLRHTYAEVLRTTRWAQVGAVEAGRWVLYPRWSSFGAIARMLGIRFVDAVANVHSKGGDAYSYETLDKLSGADVLVHQVGFDGGVSSGIRALREQDQWRTLAPVRAGHAFGLKHALVSSYGWALDALDELETTVLKPLHR